jgi:hypothetical protein
MILQQNIAQGKRIKHETKNRFGLADHPVGSFEQ